MFTKRCTLLGYHGIPKSDSYHPQLAPIDHSVRWQPTYVEQMHPPHILGWLRTFNRNMMWWMWTCGAILPMTCHDSWCLIRCQRIAPSVVNVGELVMWYPCLVDCVGWSQSRQVAEQTLTYRVLAKSHAEIWPVGWRCLSTPLFPEFSFHSFEQFWMPCMWVQGHTFEAFSH